MFRRLSLGASLTGAVLIGMGLLLPSGGVNNTTAKVTSAVAVLDPTAGSAPATRMTLKVPTGAVAGWVPARDAAAFTAGRQWAEIAGPGSVKEHSGGDVTAATRAAAEDLWRASGPVSAGQELTWTPDTSALAAVPDPVVVIVGSAALGEVGVTWNGQRERGSTSLLIIGLLLLAAGLLARFLPARFMDGMGTPGRAVRSEALAPSSHAAEHAATNKDSDDGDDGDPDDGDPDDGEGTSTGPASDKVASGDGVAAVPFRRREGPARFTVVPFRRPLRLAAIGPAFTVVALSALAGCAGQGATSVAAVPSPSASSSHPAIGSRTTAWGYPVVESAQAARIVTSVDSALRGVSTERKVDAAGGRLTGPARDIVAARLVVAKSDPDLAVTPSALKVQWLGAPVATEWPRWFAVAGSAASAATPSMRVLASDTAGTPYGLWAELRMVPGATLPQVGTLKAGAELLPADQGGLALSPQEVAIGYADVLTRGAKSDYARSFTPDIFQTQVTDRLAADRKRIVSSAVATLVSTHVPSPRQPPLAVRTSDGGALVIVTLEHEYRATIPPGYGSVRVDADLAALSGRQEFSHELVRRSVEVLAFVVPANKGLTTLVAADKGDISATGS